jgi:hypothetical protein
VLLTRCSTGRRGQSCLTGPMRLGPCSWWAGRLSRCCCAGRHETVIDGSGDGGGQLSAIAVQLARPFRHSAVQRLRQASFQAGTWWGIEHTALWQASVQAS